MGVKRPVDTDFWTDRKVVELFSPEDKLFFFYLMTNPHTTQLGVYEVSPKTMAFEIGYSTEAVMVLLDRFENKYHMIKFSQDTSEVAIRNFLRHSIVKGGKPVEDLLIKEISNVKDKRLLQYVYESLSQVANLNISVQKILPLLINDNDNVNDNDNDNDNDDSYHESYHESSGTRMIKDQIRFGKVGKQNETTNLTGIETAKDLKNYLRGNY